MAPNEYQKIKTANKFLKFSCTPLQKKNSPAKPGSNSFFCWRFVSENLLTEFIWCRFFWSAGNDKNTLQKRDYYRRWNYAGNCETEGRDGAENEGCTEIELKYYFIIVNGYLNKIVLSYGCTYVHTLQLYLN